MRVFFLTWEFPPLIAGGLGMACYGMVASLLKLGVEVDLLLPTLEEVYFRLRSPKDVDEMPVVWLRPDEGKEARVKAASSLVERLKLLGVSTRPETYLAPPDRVAKLWELIYGLAPPDGQSALGRLMLNLQGAEDVFGKIQEYTARAAAWAPRLGCDLVHAHDWLTYPAGLWIQEKAQLPLLAHIHATEFDRAGGVGDERIHHIEHAGLTGARLVAAVSRYTAEMVINRYRVAAENIRIVHNAHSFAPASLQARRRLFKDPLILFLGRITIQKGPDYFLEVAREVLKRHPRVHFIMAGAGDMMRRLVHKSASYRLKQHFLFTDFLSRQEVEDILKAADILIMPSVSEPFGIAPLEAMAYGAVAIISKQSGVAEIIQNAVKIDFWDVDKMVVSVCRLIENPDERSRMAAEGRREVWSIQWDEAATKLKRVYEELI